MSDQQDKLLEYRNLSVEFGSGENISKALKDISFSVLRGETVGIVGESGSGKSVTALSAMKLLPADISRISEGEIIFRPISNDSSEKNIVR